MHLKYYIKHLKYRIRDYFSPRQKWLTRQIPRHWIDKDTLIEKVLFASLKDFVENEIGKDSLFDKNRRSKSDNIRAQQLNFEKRLRYTYKLLTVNLPRLEQDLNDAWEKVPDFPLFVREEFAKQDYHEKYGEIDKIELKIDKLKDIICEWVVKNRRSMWI